MRRLPIPPNSKEFVLLVSPDPIEHSVLVGQLRTAGYRTEGAFSFAEAERALERGGIALVVGSSRIELCGNTEKFFARVKANYPRVIISALIGVSSASNQKLKNTVDCLIPRSESIVPWVASIFDKGSQRLIIPPYKPPTPRQVRNGEPVLIGQSPAMDETRAAIRVAARMNQVLVVGDTGTGKEPVAQMIHVQSGRKGPLIIVNAAELVASLGVNLLMGSKKGAYTGAERDRKGIFLRANGGTVFLDEVADSPLEIQAALLRVLESRRVRQLMGEEEYEIDVLVIAATNKDLKAEVAAGRFRQDLFFRLTEAVVPVFPLSDRLDDIPDLANHFAMELAAELKIPAKGFETEAMSFLTKRAYPGHARELRHVIKNAMVVAGESHWIKKEHFQDRDKAPRRAGRRIPEPMWVRVARAEREAVDDAIEATKGNRAEAARLLEMSPATLYRILGQSRSEDVTLTNLAPIEFPEDPPEPKRAAPKSEAPAPEPSKRKTETTLKRLRTKPNPED